MELNKNQSLVWAAISKDWESGVTIADKIESRGEKIGMAILYPILRTFEEENLVEAIWEEGDLDPKRDGARRRLYRRKQGGQRVLIEVRKKDGTTVGQVTHSNL